MTTQLMVKIDKGLKQRVAKKAKKQDLSLTDLVKMTFHAYDEGRIELGIMQPPERFNAKTRKLLDRALENIEQGKNLSPKFNNAKDAIAYLRNRHAR